MKLTRREALATLAALPLVDKVECVELKKDDLLILTVDRDQPETVRDATIMMLKGQCHKLGIERYLIVPRGVEAVVMEPKKERPS